jgi:hypothetical protein
MSNFAAACQSESFDERYAAFLALDALRSLLSLNRNSSLVRRAVLGWVTKYALSSSCRSLRTAAVSLVMSFISLHGGDVVRDYIEAQRRRLAALAQQEVLARVRQQTFEMSSSMLGFGLAEE